MDFHNAMPIYQPRTVLFSHLVVRHYGRKSYLVSNVLIRFTTVSSSSSVGTSSSRPVAKS